MRFAPVVICSGENLARAHGTAKVPLKTEPVAIAVKRYPKLDASRRNAFSPTTGIAATILHMMRRTPLSSVFRCSFLTLFAAMERDAINVLVEAYAREAQFGFLEHSGQHRAAPAGGRRAI